MAHSHTTGLLLSMLLAGEAATTQPPVPAPKQGQVPQGTAPQSPASATEPLPLPPETNATLREASQDLQFMRMEWRMGSDDLERARRMRVSPGEGS